MADSRRTPATAGILACLLVIAALAVPYAITDARTVGLYYESGAVNPLIAGLLAVVSLIVFAAGSRNRTDPALAAGVTLTFGVFITLVTAAWALTYGYGIVGSSLAQHRWGLLAAATTVPLAGGWYAYVLGLFGGEDAKGP
ncbi:DUF7548 family protein [Halapricum desulfuricans]|uniref:Putative membrane protein n=1 Tax=Halapricum desulfuricans TaxID=2841257 RepID=A0A897NKS6_9EURY|nr:hypothetical protein [Halapricum desulfuricans]QSG07584.1 putative membrane protein [Halapricum desulfuricans]QSG13268.1 putative membrane protein [Halapricum desulfuricans]